ncbi:uncharacterized protein PV09_01458 [Verruconis gallopava]|uniref:Uncharacterized protein n=1 Tax=Verruconis gallopava TaxID=253628 RepID=A0A0D2AL58_9PEZI|nr:uncharacterized protein PV09_01458 [Verruconis gallopava]KIW07493.1 hypothetical protein PV09_01458 [Verruconis gallopava]
MPYNQRENSTPGTILAKNFDEVNGNDTQSFEIQARENIKVIASTQDVQRVQPYGIPRESRNVQNNFSGDGNGPGRSKRKSYSRFKKSDVNRPPPPLAQPNEHTTENYHIKMYTCKPGRDKSDCEKDSKSHERRPVRADNPITPHRSNRHLLSCNEIHGPRNQTQDRSVQFHNGNDFTTRVTEKQAEHQQPFQMSEAGISAQQNLPDHFFPHDLNCSNSVSGTCHPHLMGQNQTQSAGSQKIDVVPPAPSICGIGERVVITMPHCAQKLTPFDQHRPLPYAMVYDTQPRPPPPPPNITHLPQKLPPAVTTSPQGVMSRSKPQAVHDTSSAGSGKKKFPAITKALASNSKGTIKSELWEVPSVEDPRPAHVRFNSILHTVVSQLEYLMLRVEPQAKSEHTIELAEILYHLKIAGNLCQEAQVVARMLGDNATKLNG